MNLQDKFQEADSRLQEQYKAHVIFQYERMREQFGETLRGIHNSNLYRTFKGTVQPNTRQELIPGMIQYTMNSSRYLIDETKLNQNASKYSKGVIEEAVQKINSKVGELTGLMGAINTAGSGVTFTVTGYRGKNYVHIDQSMILNVSSRGLVFNQWRALIKVNGRSVSEKDFKSLFPA